MSKYSFKWKVKDKIHEDGLSLIFLLLIPLIFLFFISFIIGRYPIYPQEIIMALASKLFHVPSMSTPAINTIIFDIRLPRIFGAMMVGGALSVAGASFQGLFRNPLVSPDKLGVSAGAGFGAALAIVFSTSAIIIQSSAFIWGLIAVAITYFFGRKFKGTSMMTLVLCGIVVSGIFVSMLSLIKYIANPNDQLQSIVFWLLGSLAFVTNQDVLIVALPIVIGTLILLMIRWRVNILSMGEEEAQTLGINPKRIESIIIICCTLITAASVSICGIIAWVGLVIPHITRMIVGPDHKILLPASIIVGAFFLLFVDDLARSLTTTEIPLGLLTTFIGAPFFIYLLIKTSESRRWS